MWRGIRSAAGIVPASRVGRKAYRWGGIALAGLGVLQVLAVPPKNNLPTALVAAVALGVGVWFLPTRTLRAAWVVALSAAAMAFAIGAPVLATFLGAMAAIFSLSRYALWRQAWSGYLAIAAATAAVAIPGVSPGQDGVFGRIYPLVYLGGAWMLGWVDRQRALYVRTLSDSAEALGRDDAQRAALAAATEHARIARELHDIVSNSVGVMVVQADAAREALTREPEQAAIALDAVADTARKTINDLRQMRGVLRDPTTALDVSDLVEPVQAAGLTVELIQAGNDRGVHPLVRSAVYRIVQDALSGTLRRSSATRVRVAVQYGVKAVEIEVIDNGAVAAVQQGDGHARMRERAGEVNGELSLGARSDGPGFRVWARLPTGGTGHRDLGGDATKELPVLQPSNRFVRSIASVLSWRRTRPSRTTT